MPADVQTIADPRFILLTWAAGLAAANAGVAFLGRVGVGFTWLTATTAGVVALAGVLTEGAWWARVGAVGLALGLLWARDQRRAAIPLVMAGALFLIEAARLGGWLPGISATLALGGVTGEMMLGHWYLVDPRLPRSLLKGLAVAGISGLVADALVLNPHLGSGSGPVTFWVLVATSVLLMVGVIGALRYPAYSGVMAATGLSYLAVLTTLGAVFVGRAAVVGLGPFAGG